MNGIVHTIEELIAIRPQFIQRLAGARRLLIGTHLNPDGDAVGSALAVALFAERLGVESEVLCNDPVPQNLSFLPQINRVRQTPEYDDHDLAVIVDLDATNRLGRTLPYFEAVPRWLVIDHHVPRESPGDERIVMVEAPATAAILADLMLDSGTTVTADCATHLLVGILTDTGNFRYPNTTPHSLKLAARLIELGADLPHMAEMVYHRKPLAAVRLLGWALNNMKASENADLVWVSIPRSVFVDLKAEEQHNEGIVNELLGIESARAAVVLREGNTKIKGSLRSRGSVDVSEVAARFGGGGHANAAGVTMETSLYDAEAAIIEALKECLASSS